MSKNKFLGILTLISLAAAPAWSYKQTETSTFPAPHAIRNSGEQVPHIGLMLGSTQPEGRFNSSAEVGIDVGFQPYVPFGLGLEATYSQLNSTVNDGKNERGTVLAKATYNLGGSIPIIRDSYVGFGVGAVIAKDKSTLATAPMVGFDIPIRDKNDQASLSFGANAKFLTAEGSEPDAVSLSGVVKYWY